jgi:Uma2 family endonuclease
MSSTATKVLHVGPADHRRVMTIEQFEACIGAEGFKYELIDGRLYVTYEPDPPEDMIEKWLLAKVQRYSVRHLDIINYVTDKARVYLPLHGEATIPEPDLAAYHDFPRHLPSRQIHWQNVSPILVGEIVSPNDPHKDLIRNVQLYLRVPSIKEYWLLDGRDDPDHPSMRVYRRHGKRWRISDLVFGATSTTKLLPGFKLILDPRR